MLKLCVDVCDANLADTLYVSCDVGSRVLAVVWEGRGGELSGSCKASTNTSPRFVCAWHTLAKLWA